MPLNTARLAALQLRRSPDAKAVVWGSTLTYGLLRASGELEAVDGGFVPVTTHSVLVAAGALPGLAQNDTLTIGGVAYAVRSPQLPIENGDLVRILLVPVA